MGHVMELTTPDLARKYAVLPGLSSSSLLAAIGSIPKRNAQKLSTQYIDSIAMSFQALDI